MIVKHVHIGRRIRVNKWIGYGRLVRDPDLRYTNSGKAICNMTLAVEDGYGKYKKVDYIRVIVWGKKGEAAAKYLFKGRQAIVEGRLSIRKNKKGDKEFINPEIVASTVKFISSPKQEEDAEDTKDTTEEETNVDIDDEEVLF